MLFRGIKPPKSPWFPAPAIQRGRVLGIVGEFGLWSAWITVRPSGCISSNLICGAAWSFAISPGCGCCTGRSSAPDVRPGPGRVAKEVLATAPQFDPEITFQGGMVPSAIHNHALLRLALHLLKCKRIADQLVSDLTPTLCIVRPEMYLVINRKS